MAEMLPMVNPLTPDAFLAEILPKAHTLSSHFANPLAGPETMQKNVGHWAPAKKYCLMLICTILIYISVPSAMYIDQSIQSVRRSIYPSALSQRDMFLIWVCHMVEFARRCPRYFNRGFVKNPQ